MTCDATCDPSCNFRWEDASGNLVSEGKSLQLSDVTSSNTGTYSCVADNGVGTPARRSITVNVLSEWSVCQGSVRGQGPVRVHAVCGP